jgi:hypothetical protein
MCSDLKGPENTVGRCSSEVGRAFNRQGCGAFFGKPRRKKFTKQELSYGVKHGYLVNDATTETGYTCESWAEFSRLYQPGPVDDFGTGFDV